MDLPITLDRPLALPTYTDQGLRLNTAYTYHVTATNWCGLESVRSGAVSVRPNR